MRVQVIKKGGRLIDKLKRIDRAIQSTFQRVERTFEGHLIINVFVGELTLFLEYNLDNDLNIHKILTIKIKYQSSFFLTFVLSNRIFLVS